MPILGGFCPFPLRLSDGDLESGWSAAQHARSCADLSAACQTSDFAVFRVQHSTQTIEYYVSNYGVGLSYVPTVGYNGGTKTYTFSWDNTYSDRFLTSNLLLLKGVEVYIENGPRIRPIKNLVTPRQLTVELTHIEAGTVALDGFTVIVT